MRIIDWGPETGREITSFGSTGLTATHLATGDVRVTVLRVAAGGEIGRHPATVDQLFMVVSGRGTVCGSDGVGHQIAAGQAAVWTAGEEHTTRADEDLCAVVMEMRTLSLVG